MDKNKVIEAAAKLVAKGAYDKAIKEYQKILDADPKDVRILQKMGELYQKKNDEKQAAHFFTKVAESYSSDGFFLKAVALYKQVLKLNPNLIDVNLKLAELHQQLQLMSEAMSYYQIVANHYDKAGDTKSSLDTLKKMVDLDPDNVASRTKLAELYAREHMNAEAIEEFSRSAEYLKRNNRLDDYFSVCERMSVLDPNNLALARELAQGYLSRGDQKRALAKLQVCFKADPRDIDTLKLLDSAFEGLGQTSKRVSVFKEMAKVYTERGSPGEVEQVWRQIEAIDPTDPDLVAHKSASAPRAAPAAPVRPAAPAAAAPAPAPAPAPVAAAPAAAPPGRESLGKLLTETDVYVKYGLHDKALEHLRKVFAIDPENLDAHEKAYQIYVNAKNTSQASEQLLNVLRLCTRRAEVQRAQPYLATILEQNPNHPEVPAFVAVLGNAEAAADEQVFEDTQQEEVAPPQDDEAILVDTNDEEIVVAPAPADALAVDDVALHAAGSDEDEGTIVESAGFDEDLGANVDDSDEPVVQMSGGDSEDEPLVSDEMSLDGGDEQLVSDETGEEVDIAAAADEASFGEMSSSDDDDAQIVVSDDESDLVVSDEEEEAHFVSDEEPEEQLVSDETDANPFDPESTVAYQLPVGGIGNDAPTTTHAVPTELLEKAVSTEVRAKPSAPAAPVAKAPAKNPLRLRLNLSPSSKKKRPSPRHPKKSPQPKSAKRPASSSTNLCSKKRAKFSTPFSSPTPATHAPQN